ncbi:MAG: nucleoside monophosphate kinase [bacterium]|nr:nucleoside monophosphate kinase [bacterium]
MNIILMGPQGSGKGTQAKLLSEKLNLFYFEMGGFLRKLAEKNLLVSEIINKRGELLPDDMFFFAMKKLLGEKVSEGKGIILDGFPRTLRQYGLLKNWFSEENIKIDMVIFLDVGEKESIKRLSVRRIYEKRDDDQPEQIKKRLQIFDKETKPLLDIFRKEGILVKINGERPVDEIQKDLVEIIESK